MKVMLLSNVVVSHTIKWVRALSEQHEIVLFSLNSTDDDYFKQNKNVSFITLNYDNALTVEENTLKKYNYLKAVPFIRKAIMHYKPDILHAHYASSYGLIGALTGFHPYVVSVWGSDVYDFPKKSIIHRELLKYSLKRSDAILSTSEVMALETAKYTKKQIHVTPFGIDTQIFKSRKVDRIFEENSIVVGTIKTLDEKYGIDYLIKAFAIVKKGLPELPLKLLIVGGGPLEQKLKHLTTELQIENETCFTGRVNYDEVNRYHNEIDIYCALSILDSESFGVAIIEASASEKPVIVSSVGGLPEVVDNGVSGIVVPPKDEQAAAIAIEKLILNESMRKRMGINGRKRVIEKYEWINCVNLINSIYKDLLTKY